MVGQPQRTAEDQKLLSKGMNLGKRDAVYIELGDDLKTERSQ